MSVENDDRRKTSHSETLENTVAIGKLTAIQERTTNDVDKLVRHIEKILPVHAILAHLKTILYSGLIASSSFGVWITIEHFSTKQDLATFIAIQKEKNTEAAKERNTNKNQIQYVKGRIK